MCDRFIIVIDLFLNPIHKNKFRYEYSRNTAQWIMEQVLFSTLWGTTILIATLTVIIKHNYIIGFRNKSITIINLSHIYYKAMCQQCTILNNI
jgi:hypothetical protein